MGKIIEGTVKVNLKAYNEGIACELVVLSDGLTGEQLIDKIEDAITDKFNDVYIKTFSD